MKKLADKRLGFARLLQSEVLRVAGSKLQVNLLRKVNMPAARLIATKS